MVDEVRRIYTGERGLYVHAMGTALRLTTISSSSASHMPHSHHHPANNADYVLTD